MTIEQKVLAPGRRRAREGGAATRDWLPAARLLGSAVRCLIGLSLESRLSIACAALIVHLAAFSLWWMCCYCFGPSPWWYLPALLLAHPLVLFFLACRLALGALLNQAWGRGFPLERVLGQEPLREPSAEASEVDR